MPDSALLDKPGAQIARALADAQADMDNPATNKENDHFRNKYATLDVVRDAVVPALTEHGIAVTQTPEFRDGRFVLVTTLRHESGEIIESVWPLPDKVEPQKMGSALTYARRYGLSSIVCISADEDDDGNAAQAEGQKPSGASRPANGKASPPAATATKAKAATPHDPETGEVREGKKRIKPHPIEVEPLPNGTGSDWQKWTKKFMGAVATSANKVDVEDWLYENAPKLETLKAVKPSAEKTVQQRIEAFKNTLPPEGAMAGPDDAELDRMADAAMGPG